MPPHLHPRSTATSTLFAGTLVASFVVVAIPHLVPCPRPRGRGHFDNEVQLDESGKPVRRVRKVASSPEKEAALLQKYRGDTQASRSLQDEVATFRQLKEEAEVLKAEKKDRECPVPKPKGTLGRWLGFDNGKNAVIEVEE